MFVYLCSVLSRLVACTHPDSESARLVSDIPVELPPGVTPLQLLEEHAELVRDVHQQKKCRRCKASLENVGTWEYVRRESLATPFVRDGPAVVAMSWRCRCGALHLGESLPARGKYRRLWSEEDDLVIKVLGAGCPIRESPERTSRKRARSR